MAEIKSKPTVKHECFFCFCAVPVVIKSGDTYQVTCKCCGARGASEDTMKEAVDRWNCVEQDSSDAREARREARWSSMW